MTSTSRGIAPVGLLLVTATITRDTCYPIVLPHATLVYVMIRILTVPLGLHDHRVNVLVFFIVMNCINWDRKSNIFVKMNSDDSNRFGTKSVGSKQIKVNNFLLIFTWPPVGTFSKFLAPLDLCISTS